MDAIKVPKVDDVYCNLGYSKRFKGSIYVTQHHLILRPSDAQVSGGDSSSQSVTAEIWIAYPTIQTCVRSSQTAQGVTPIRLTTKTFKFFILYIADDKTANDLYDSLLRLTCVKSLDRLYAFHYSKGEGSSTTLPWSLYDPLKEFARMGIPVPSSSSVQFPASQESSHAWRYTSLNQDYQFCDTYPAVLVVPAKISDNTLFYGKSYRSKNRIPVLTYLHRTNGASITRSSQPMVGLKQARSVQDEKLIEAVFASHLVNRSDPRSEKDLRAHEAYDVSSAGTFHHSSPAQSPGPGTKISTSSVIYGATTTNLIIDARPTANAVANVAKGAGTENMEHYRNCRKAYMGIENIHVMRDSLGKMVEAIRDASMTSTQVDKRALGRSGWIRHIKGLLEGALLIIRNIHVASSHVLIHCSDGWDRTSQFASLAEVCLDPHYRTIKGFIVLIEKDYLSFGHKFSDRSAHLGSEKGFQTVLQAQTDSQFQVAQSRFLSIQNRMFGGSRPSEHIHKESSPIFHQFLDCVHQLLTQFPHRFEFDMTFLIHLHTQLHECQYGNLLFNSEKERSQQQLNSKTRSLWQDIISRMERGEFVNKSFDSSLDQSTDQGVIMPEPGNIRYWSEIFSLEDVDLNGIAREAVRYANPEAAQAVSALEEPSGQVLHVQPDAVERRKIQEHSQAEPLQPEGLHGDASSYVQSVSKSPIRPSTPTSDGGGYGILLRKHFQTFQENATKSLQDVSAAVRGGWTEVEGAWKSGAEEYASTGAIKPYKSGHVIDRPRPSLVDVNPWAVPDLQSSAQETTHNMNAKDRVDDKESLGTLAGAAHKVAMDPLGATESIM